MYAMRSSSEFGFHTPTLFCGRRYDKLGSATLITSAKKALLSKLGKLTKTGRLPKMTKKRCEAFFDDPENFDLAP
jgi:hypothetical protein